MRPSAQFDHEPSELCIITHIANTLCCVDVRDAKCRVQMLVRNSTRCVAECDYATSCYVCVCVYVSVRRLLVGCSLMRMRIIRRTPHSSPTPHTQARRHTMPHPTTHTMRTRILHIINTMRTNTHRNKLHSLPRSQHRSPSLDRSPHPQRHRLH